MSQKQLVLPLRAG